MRQNPDADCADPGAKAASLRRARYRLSEHECDQLIKRVDRLEPNKEKYRDHQIGAEMHGKACNRRLLAARGTRAGVGKSNAVRSGKRESHGEYLTRR